MTPESAHLDKCVFPTLIHRDSIQQVFSPGKSRSWQYKNIFGSILFYARRVRAAGFTATPSR